VTGLKNTIPPNINAERASILGSYQASTQAYYDNIAKELAANMTTLQIKDFISKDLTKKELENLPRNRIDEILDKIRKMKDKTKEEESILAVDTEYKEAYLDPARKNLEENMTMLLGITTRGLFNVLGRADVITEDIKEGKRTFNMDLTKK